MKGGSFLIYVIEVLMQLIHGFYVEQGRCYVINARNLKVKVTKTPCRKLLNLKVFEVVLSQEVEKF